MPDESNLIVPFRHIKREEISAFYELSDQRHPQWMASVFPHPDPLTLVSTIFRTPIFLGGTSCCVMIRGEVKAVANLLMNCMLLPLKDGWAFGYPGYGKPIPMPIDCDLYIPLRPATPDHTLVQLQYALLRNPPSALIEN